MLKRSFDLCVSLLLIGSTLPLIAIVALLIRTRLGKPVLFRQQRPGFNGKPFTVYKFRTMAERRDANGVLLADELRLTPLGETLRRLSLDELPQFFNVLKGDMSLVGPRPLLMGYLPLYSPLQARRHAVRPGITGWAQVNGRNAIDWRERFELDVWYVDHQSFGLDLRILWLTLVHMFRPQGINKPGLATMDKFTGNHGD